MCTFILLVVPRVAQLEPLKATLEQHGFAYRQCEDAKINRAIGADEQAILTTRGWCDCGTALAAGPGASRHEHERASLDAEAAKLRTRGWSEAKISRWLTERERAIEKRVLADEARGQGNGERERWAHFLNVALERGIAPRIGVLMRVYGVAGEPMPPLRRVRVPQQEIVPERMRDMEDGTVYEFGGG